MTMKRSMAPKFWPVERKTKKYVVDPRPGPHGKYSSMPLGVVLRDVLKYAFTNSESRSILNAGHVVVDGVVRKDTGFPVGLMDVLTIGQDSYRVLAGRRGLHLLSIDKHETGVKLLRVAGKTCVSKEKTQVHLHDGTNMLADAVHAKKYKTGDVIVVDTASKTVKDVVKMEKGAKVLITKGNNVGTLGTVEDVIVTKSPMPNQVVVDIGTRKISLPCSYVFAVGRAEPVIKLHAGQVHTHKHEGRGV